MLIRYKKSYEKIAMGLIDLMLDEKDVKKLVCTIRDYEQEVTQQLWLWKENDDVIGLIGFKETDAHEILVQHLSVNPSFQNMGYGEKILKSIIDAFPEKKIVGTSQTSPYIEKVISEAN